VQTDGHRPSGPERGATCRTLSAADFVHAVQW
jgi:hypothetical protein